MEQQIRIERRMYERLPMEFDGKLQALQDRQAKPTRIVNIGPHGFCLLLQEDLEEGATLRVQFTLEEDEVTLNAAVLWSHPAEGGGYKAGTNILGGSRFDEEKFINFYASKFLMAFLV